MLRPPWQPTIGTIPRGFETTRLRVRPLTIHDAVKDYDAVMSSRSDLQGLFPGSDWPPEDLSLEQDLIDLAWHQKEFQMGSSYTYTVVSLDESKVLGCIYLFPPTNPGSSVAELIFWVRSSERSSGLEGHLRDELKIWLRGPWGFSDTEVDRLFAA